MALRDGEIRYPTTGVQNFTGTGNLTIPARIGQLKLIQLTIDARGTFNSATVQAQRTLDATNYAPIGTGITADGQEVLTDSTLGSGSGYRINVGAVTSVNVVAYALFG